MEVDGLQRLNTAEGRELEFLVEGPESEVALVFHLETPTAAIPVPQVTDPAAALGLRTVTYS